MKMNRWHVEVTYKDKTTWKSDIEELYRIHDLIESGPDWNTIKNIVITLNRVTQK
jgi:hypothetical protein